MRSAIRIAVLILAVATARLVRAASDPRRTLKAEEPVVTEKVFFDITIGGEDEDDFHLFSFHDLFVIYDNCGHRVGWEGGEGIVDDGDGDGDRDGDGDGDVKRG